MPTEEVSFQFGMPEFGILLLVLALVYGISYLWKLVGAGRRRPPPSGARPDDGSNGRGDGTAEVPADHEDDVPDGASDDEPDDEDDGSGDGTDDDEQRELG